MRRPFTIQGSYMSNINHAEMERFSDPIDEASQLAANLTENAIAAVRQAIAPETHPDFDGATCVECGDDMPPERLAAKRVRCTSCQSELEHRNRQRGGRRMPAGWPE